MKEMKTRLSEDQTKVQNESATRLIYKLYSAYLQDNDLENYAAALLMEWSKDGKVDGGAPVLKPSVYFMADGKFGMKLSISLAHGIRIDSNPESTDSGSSGCLYELEEPPAKRQRMSPSE
jgi:hypothetical protein